MAHVDVVLPTASGPAPIVPPKKTSLFVNLLAGTLILALGGFIVFFGQAIYKEWVVLQREQAIAHNSRSVGYIEISPRVSYARPPGDWFRQDDDGQLLWSGWRDGKHEWFRFPPGELDAKQLAGPEGRDVLRAIDHPIIEVRGGIRWDRMPEDARIVGLEWKGNHVAIPHSVLERVRVMNHEIDGSPLLVIWRPYVDSDQAATVYDPLVSGERLTFGNSGYYSAGHSPHRPLMYDRATLSLWVEEADSLNAIAGAHRGSTLKRIQPLTSSSWSTWRALHPQGGIVVGADRSKGLPEL